MDTLPSSFSQGAGPPGLHSSRWAPTSSQSLTKQIVVASVVSIVALAIVCGLGLSSLRRLSLQNDAEMAQRLALLDESEVFQLLLYQKGFAVDFMFTGDERWLHELDQGRREFADWLTQADRTADTAEERRLLERIRRDYRQLDEEHTAMISQLPAWCRAGSSASASSADLHATKRSGAAVRGVCADFVGAGPA
jgi:hypothetical protein